VLADGRAGLGLGIACHYCMLETCDLDNVMNYTEQMYHTPMLGRVGRVTEKDPRGSCRALALAEETGARRKEESHFG
jgi:hypothetical protein